MISTIPTNYSWQIKSHIFHHPKWPLKFLQIFLKAEYLEEVEGDMEEIFQDNLEHFSPPKARRMYMWDTLKLIRPILLKNINDNIYLNQYDMFRHNFMISYRTLLKNKGYSLINIGGLAVGMAVAILIGLWMQDELSYNHYHTNHDHIAQVMRNGTINGETHTFPYLPYALGNKLKTTYGSHFKHVLFGLHTQEFMLSVGDRQFGHKGTYIESGVIEMLSLKMIEGGSDALEDPRSTILSASTAHILFGDEDPVGKIVNINGSLDVEVSGVFEDLPSNTKFHEIDFWLPWELFATTNEWVKQQGFDINFLQIYVELQPNEEAPEVSQLIKDIILDNVAENEEYVAINPQVVLHEMNDWHLYSQWKDGKNVGGRIQFVWLFGLIGLFVLILACINFMNLSTARSEKRAKEVGIRKSLGSIRVHLIGQFLSESFLVTLIAFSLAIILVQLVIPWFNGIADKDIHILWSNPIFWMISIGFILLTALLAGSYPALYLSAFEPINVLKGVLQVGKRASIPRKILVVVQFTVSIALIIGTIIVYQQIEYAKDRPIGYEQERLITMQMRSPELRGKSELLRNELLKSGAITEMGQSISPITGVTASDGGFDWQGKDPGLQTDFVIVISNTEYGKTIGWEIKEGRDFSRDFSNDSSGVIINETTAKMLGFENPVGEFLKWESTWYKAGDFKILGVVKDMVMLSPYEPIHPTIFLLGEEGDMHWMLLKINPNIGTHEALAQIEAVFKEVVPSTPFDYTFVDEVYAVKFGEEERIGKVAAFFAILAIFISFLGLFGLASFVAEQRTKEIGIRKVLGASVSDLWKLLSKDFVILVMISCLIAIPIAWYSLQNWLQNYSYHIDISIWVFVIAALGALLITLLTVSFQAIRAALANPVESLRME